MTDQENPIVIPINSNGDTPEWAMLELNGELLTPKEIVSAAAGKENPASCLVDSDSFELGTVRFVNQEPVMICGTHELKGKVETLKQPFCVLQKKQENENVSYQIRGVVTRKLLFNRYPKTIMR